MYKMRVLSQGKYEDRGYSNEESIAYLGLQKPVELNRLIENAKIQSTESSNQIEGIVTTNARLLELVQDAKQCI
mgnify:CR=1 FL=1